MKTKKEIRANMIEHNIKINKGNADEVRLGIPSVNQIAFGTS